MLCELYMAGALVGTLLFGGVLGSSWYTEDIRSRMVKGQVVWVLLLGAIVSIAGDGGEWSAMRSFVTDSGMTGLGKGVVLLVGGAIIWIGSSGLVVEYSIVGGLALVGAMIMISANDMIGMYIGIELQGIGYYAMAAGKRGSSYSSEAGLKYYIVGAIGTGLMLYGTAQLYGTSGSLAWESIVRAGVDRMGISLWLVGIMLKLGVAPFHGWSIDVYEGSRTETGMYLAIVPKVGLVVLLCRAMPMWEGIGWIMVLGGLLSAGVGALGAYRVRRLKAFLAYSSVGQVGYIMCGLGAGLDGRAALVYAIIYTIVATGIWGIMVVMDGAGWWRLGRENRAGAMGMVIGMGSLAGIPPILGFYGKWLVLEAMVGGGIRIGAVCMVLIGVLSAYNYMRVVKELLFERTQVVRREKGGTKVSGGGAYMIGIAVAMSVPLWY